MFESYVNLNVESNIGFIEFFTPSHNALPSNMLHQLVEVIERAGNDQSVKIIVLKSGGDRTFCAGASFDELKTIDSMEKGKDFFSGFANVINAMRKCPKLIIGRVQGKAVGGGVGLIAATDYCVATQYASLKLSELSIGIGPFVIAPAIERKAGLAALSELTLNCTQFYSAEWAKNKGFFANVFEDVNSLDQAVWELATNLSSYNPEA
ncbi:MAG: enoyl-CoA hydratase/isomerase family protein, partial [Mangrovimonas sp.]|nr:enoyl-CoA hydratase/isomerase family protein [Mangrovimonas sp.]